MAYNQELAQKVKILLESKPGFEIKKMFGGVCFLLHGNMACGVLDDYLIVRVGLKNYDELLTLSDTKKFDVSGRPMKGWVMVSNLNQKKKKDLAGWVDKGVDFVRNLPPKK